MIFNSYGYHAIPGARYFHSDTSKNNAINDSSNSSNQIASISSNGKITTEKSSSSMVSSASAATAGVGLKRVMRLAEPEKYLIATSILSLFITSSVSLFLPIGLGQILDSSLQQAGITSSSVLQAASSTSKMLNQIPYIGELSSLSPVYLATGLIGLFASKVD